MKTGGLEVSHDTEVTEGAKSSGQTLGKLEQTIDGLDGAIGEPSLQESDDTAPMFLDAPCQLAEGFEPTELGPFAPPAQGLLIFVGEDVLEMSRRPMARPLLSQPSPFVLVDLRPPLLLLWR